MNLGLPSRSLHGSLIRSSSFCGSEPQQWTHLNRGETGSRMTRSPFQCSVKIRHIDDAESCEKLLRFCIRAVMDLPFSVANRTVVAFRGESSPAPATNTPAA